MTIKPILFSGPMVRALLEGRKTQTRRVLNPQPKRGATVFRDGDFWYQETKHGPGSDCTVMDGVDVNYASGDLLYVREAWRTRIDLDESSPAKMIEDCLEAGYQRPWCPIIFEADGMVQNRYEWDYAPIGRLRQAMHMPRAYSRLTLRVTEVRVQRLQEISEDDARAEGVEFKAPTDEDLAWYREWAAEHGIDPVAEPMQGVWLAPGTRQGFGEHRASPQWGPDPAFAFKLLWNSLNEKRGFGWDVNPWVTAISFEVIRANVDSIKEQTND